MHKIIQMSVILLFLALPGSAQNVTIQLTSPTKNARFKACSDIQFAANVTIQTGSIKRVEFYVNGTRYKTDSSAPYEAAWPSVPDGIYEIVATAVDANNATISTEPIFVYVGNVQPGNMIINGEFNCALAPWFLDNYVNAQSTAILVPDLWLTDDSSGVLVEIENQGDEFWAVQLMQPFKIREGHTYEVTFTAQADEPKEIHVDISKNYDDYAPLHSATFTIDRADVYGPFTFTAAADDKNLMFKFVLGGNTIPIEIDAVNVIDEQWTKVATVQDAKRAFMLEQNYPNPFNPNTTITYSLDKAGPINFSIYNILGQQILSYTAYETAGKHSFVWDGTTSLGEDVPSGLYIYRLETAAGSRTRKMFLLR
ncbi:T9SS C-terminal target domain-containing protein [candidate division KSB1 bacterium]|nr:T9SS type A sorting domain-containing protein [candidate division KSB1 bacterium]RQW04175.1 MAG: T9SS C-terminal target domain-containing protein [candidate division KSB1 bacterium]